MPLTCTDADGDTLTLSIVDDPSKGTLGAISGGAVTYTPDAGEFGADSFTYKANDGDGDSAPATVDDHDHAARRPARTCRARPRSARAVAIAARLHGSRR